MNKEEKLEKIKGMKKYFFISFLVSFVILLLSSLICVIYHDNQIMIMEKFFGLDAEDYSYMVVLLLGLWKLLIIQFTLIPALALWIIEKNCCHCKK